MKKLVYFPEHDKKDSILHAAVIKKPNGSYGASGEIRLHIPYQPVGNNWKKVNNNYWMHVGTYHGK